MSAKRKNSKLDFSENPLETFPRTTIDWEKSKDEIWVEFERKVDFRTAR
jgi:hypothetical protein